MQINLKKAEQMLSSQRFIFGMCIAIGVCFVIYLLGLTALFDRLELSTVDMRFRLRPKHSIHPQVALVLVGDETLEQYGFPLSRRYYAIVADALLEHGAKAVGFDIFFDEVSRGDSSGDLLLNEVTKIQDNVVHAMELSIVRSPRGVAKDDRMERFALKGEIQGKEKIHRTGKVRLLPYDSLLDSTTFLGNVSSVLELDNSVRRYPLVVERSGSYYPAFGLLLACRTLDITPDELKIKVGESVILTDGKGNNISIPIDNKGQMGVNYVGGLESFRIQYQFYDLHQAILSNPAELDIFKDKVVIIGVHDSANTDVRPTPFAQIFPGVGIHAMVVSNILQNDFMSYTGSASKVVLIIIFAFFAIILQMLLQPKYSSIAFALLLCALLLIAWFSFSYTGMVINVTQPFFGAIFAFGGSMFYSYVDEKRRAKKLHDIFERQVSPQILAHLKMSDTGLVPGEKRKLTMLFSDIKGYTTWSEQLEPVQLVAQMNEYFSVMLDKIISNGGVINKFIGDAIVALFGMEKDQEDEAPLQAIKAALDMQESLKELNEERAKEGLPPMNMRVGINTGEVAFGGIGTVDRAELTVMGDHVNVAQRTEGECEPGRVAITEFTYAEVEGKIQSECLGLRELKGREQAVTIYHVLTVVERPA